MPYNGLERAFVGIGANLDDPEASVRRAVASIASVPDTKLIAASSLYRTAPVGYLDQPDFVNAVAGIETRLDPAALLEQLLLIEAQFGRKRSTRNAPRTLDLDLLLHGNQRVTSPRLTLPHPRMAQRAFVLVPLAEIAPDVVVGALGTAAQLLSLVSTNGVERIGKADDLVSSAVA